jgi:two-component system alkaline phosphatase synthesis response regulator PhoP
MGPLQTQVVPHYQDPHLDLDFEHKVAKLDTQPMGLTRKEYELLAMLIQNAGEVVDRETLLFRIWGYTAEIKTRTLDVHIRRLRKKMGAQNGAYIETIFGVGYRFQPYRASKPITLMPSMAMRA